MKLLLVSTFIVAVASGALLPVDTSLVKVKSEHSGKDYSYSIHESRGFAVDAGGAATVHVPAAVVHDLPVLKFSAETPTKETQNDHLQKQAGMKEASAQMVREYVVPTVNYHYLPAAVPYAYTFPYLAYPYNLVTLRSP